MLLKCVFDCGTAQFAPVLYNGPYISSVSKLFIIIHSPWLHLESSPDSCVFLKDLDWISQVCEDEEPVKNSIHFHTDYTSFILFSLLRDCLSI